MFLFLEYLEAALKFLKRAFVNKEGIAMVISDLDLCRGELTYVLPAKNKKISLIALSTDVTAEHDLVCILPI